MEVALTALTTVEVEATAVTEVADATTTAIAAPVTTIAILAPQGMDVVMTTALEASIATHQAVMIATAAETIIAVGETTLVTGAVAMEMRLQEIHMPEVETKTILQMIGTPVARAPC